MWNKVMLVAWNMHFLRMCLFSFCLLGARQIFRHFDATLPKVLLRQFGANSHFGALYSINPLIVAILAPIVNIIMPPIDVYAQMIVGSLFSSLSPFIVYGVPTIVGYEAFMVVFSLAEVVYSPQADAYIMNLTPAGEEGLYISLTNAPNFISKVVVGPLSAHLLSAYCPDVEHNTDCRSVWPWVALVALSTPMLLTLSMRFIHTDEIRAQMESKKKDDNDVDEVEEEEEEEVEMRRLRHQSADNDDDACVDKEGLCQLDLKRFARGAHNGNELQYGGVRDIRDGTQMNF